MGQSQSISERRRRLGIVIAAVVLVVAWSAARGPASGALPSVRGTPVAAAVVVPIAAVITSRRAVAPNTPQRNPFMFGVPTAHPIPAAPRVVSVRSVAPDVEEPPLPTLLAIAEDQTLQGVVRTAVFISGENVLLRKAGEELDAVVFIVAIDAGAVTIQDRRTRQTRQLELRRE